MWVAGAPGEAGFGGAFSADSAHDDPRSWGSPSFTGPHGGKYLITMRNEGGAWKVNQIAAEPYPLGSPGVQP